MTSSLFISHNAHDNRVLWQRPGDGTDIPGKCCCGMVNVLSLRLHQDVSMLGYQEV